MLKILDCCGFTLVRREGMMIELIVLTNILTSCIFISMIVNDNEKRLMALLSEKGGRITAKQASLAGIHRMFLKQLSDAGKIVRVARGVYQLETAQEDELLNLQHRCPTGVFSCETALFLHSLTERAPFMWTMTFKGFYHSPTLAENGIVVKHSSKNLYPLESKNLYPLEIVEVKTPLGNVVRTYSAERTLCEIMTAKVAADIQTITYAIKTYVGRKEKNIPKLMQLAKTFHVEKKLRAYLEVLL